MANDEKHVWRVTIGPYGSDRLVLSEHNGLSKFVEDLDEEVLDDIGGEAEILEAEYVGEVSN